MRMILLMCPLLALVACEPSAKESDISSGMYRRDSGRCSNYAVKSLPKHLQEEAYLRCMEGGGYTNERAAIQSPAPYTSSSPSSSSSSSVPAVPADAGGRLTMKDGRVLPADRWWEDGNLLVYEWQGKTEIVLRDTVIRIEGQPKPRETIVGLLESRPSSASGQGSPADTTPSGPPESSMQTTGAAAKVTVNAVAPCYWTSAPRCLTSFPGGTFEARRTSQGVLWGWRWNLFLANSGPSGTVDVRLEFRNDKLENDFVKVCGAMLPAYGTRTIADTHSTRESAGMVSYVTIEVSSNAKWC